VGGCHGGAMGGREFGGPRFSGGFSRGFQGHGFGHGFHGPGFGHGFHGHGFGHGFHGHGFRCFGCFRRFPRFWGWSGYPWWGWGYPGWYDSSYSQSNYSAYQPAPQYDYSDNQDDERQQAEIDSLRDEVARLREQRQPTSDPIENEQKTELIFRDKHSEQIQNYAI